MTTVDNYLSGDFHASENISIFPSEKHPLFYAKGVRKSKRIKSNEEKIILKLVTENTKLLNILITKYNYTFDKYDKDETFKFLTKVIDEIISSTKNNSDLTIQILDKYRHHLINIIKASTHYREENKFSKTTC